ncbi:MAG: hypothetical protein ACPL5F_07190 [Moorellaceae bacterium]
MGRTNNPRLRRLELRLPPDHPVWSLPPGQRAERVRECLDLYTYLEQKFSMLAERLDRLEQVILHSGGGGNKPREEERRLPDPEVWLKAWN